MSEAMPGSAKTQAIVFGWMIQKPIGSPMRSTPHSMEKTRITRPKNLGVSEVSLAIAHQRQPRERAQNMVPWSLSIVYASSLTQGKRSCSALAVSGLEAVKSMPAVF